MRASASSPGSVAPARRTRSRRPGRGPRSGRAGRRRPRRRWPGASSRTASTSAGRDVLAAADDPVGPPVERRSGARRRRGARGRRSRSQPSSVNVDGGRGRVAEVAGEAARGPDLDLPDPGRVRVRRSGPRRRAARRPALSGMLARPPRSGAPSRPSRPRSGRRSGRPASRPRPPGGRGPAGSARRRGGRRAGSAAAARRRRASSSRASVVGTSETWLGAGRARSAATIAAGSGRARTTSGTPAARPARRPRARRRGRGRAPAASRSPAAGPRATPRRWRSSAAVERTAALGRPVVPEVRTTTAGAAGSDASRWPADAGADGRPRPTRSSSASNGRPRASADAPASNPGPWTTRRGSMTSPAAREFGRGQADPERGGDRPDPRDPGSAAIAAGGRHAPAARPRSPGSTPGPHEPARDRVGALVELAPGPADRPIHDRQRRGTHAGRRPAERRRAGARRGGSPAAHPRRDPTASTRNRSSARTSRTIPSPPLPGPPGACIRPSATSSDSTSRSCSSRPAVASPWSGGRPASGRRRRPPAGAPAIASAAAIPTPSRTAC